MPIKNGLAGAVRQGHEMGCRAIQVFTKSPQLWKSKPISDEMVDDFTSAVKETGLTDILVHDSYLINLSAATEELREKSIQGLIEELNRCHQYGIRFCNSHMGAHVGQGVSKGIELIIEATQRILNETDESATILMETTAGTGSSLGSRFEELRDILDGLQGHPRVGICLDTCHVFAAGYDIRTEETYNETWEQFETILGLERLKMIHCNDSLGGLASRKDRHAEIGLGEIGLEPFRWLVNDPRFFQIPIILETPMENQGHERDLAKLKAFQDV